MEITGKCCPENKESPAAAQVTFTMLAFCLVVQNVWIISPPATYACM